MAYIQYVCFTIKINSTEYTVLSKNAELVNTVWNITVHLRYYRRLLLTDRGNVALINVFLLTDLTITPSQVIMPLRH